MIYLFYFETNYLNFQRKFGMIQWADLLRFKRKSTILLFHPHDLPSQLLNSKD